MWLLQACLTGRFLEANWFIFKYQKRVFFFWYSTTLHSLHILLDTILFKVPGEAKLYIWIQFCNIHQFKYKESNVFLRKSFHGVIINAYTKTISVVFFTIYITAQVSDKQHCWNFLPTLPTCLTTRSTTAVSTRLGRLRFVRAGKTTGWRETWNYWGTVLTFSRGS